MSEIIEKTIEPLIQDYIVDFASNNNFFFVKGIQGDGYGVRYARLSLSNNGQPYIIDKDAVRAVLLGTKPDTKEICNVCEIVDSSTIQFEITQQMLAVPGKGDYSVAIMSTSTNQMLTSFPFYIFSNQTTFDASYVTSSNEFTLLISKINQVDALSDDVKLVINNAELVIADCEEKTQLCVEATNSAKLATEDIRTLEESITIAENSRVEAEILREENSAIAVRNAEKATEDAITATNDLRILESEVEATEASRVEAENLRQTNTATAIANAEQATQNAIDATTNANNATADANTATMEAQKRIDEYDSLDLVNVTNAAIQATEQANIATNNANTATSNANTATNEAILAAQDARKAIEEIQEAVGIDDTKEGSTTTWSSSYIKEKLDTLHTTVTEETNTAIENSKEWSQRYRLSNITITVDDWADKVVFIKNDKITENSIID